MVILIWGGPRREEREEGRMEEGRKGGGALRGDWEGEVIAVYDHPFL
ncbi:hypothetical protein DYBT9623_00567 [Dyadobacter sp. CECT 9623]|uniref:Uncharacterized protein n=1 Tax=Dyadobacter linearis TaxID=2823330 RepID=A0ABM8UK41_9BACT|nr:hypothetical protein DYBT9623_00567 [Dyadobacter sp. CECT 9623]